MSFRRNDIRTRSISTGRRQQTRFYSNESVTDLTSNIDSIPNNLPELSRIVRKLLPQEIPVKVHVRNVDYIENECEQLSGTLYLTIFRLVFAPDNEVENNNFIVSGNKYISEYDIPLTSIYKIVVAPVDSRLGFKSFLNENQIQSETRSFTIITRDFRKITFSNCSVIKSNSIGNKQQLFATNMETYINTLSKHSHIYNKEQLYPYVALQKPSTNQYGRPLSPLASSSSGRSVDDDINDFCASNDDRIKSYLTYPDWEDELYDANESQWVVNRMKFDRSSIVQDEGPFIRLAYGNMNDDFNDLIWHWTHTSENSNLTKYMLITVPNIGEITIAGDSGESSSINKSASSTPQWFLNLSKKLCSTTNNDLPVIFTNEPKTTTNGGLMIVPPKSPSIDLRRTATDSALMYSAHYIYDQPFRRYNLSKFPCNLKRLQASYEKLIEICVISPEDDDDKWLTKINTCKWLKYISKALHGAASLAKLLNYKNIQLSGSDIDNSCLMASLIQILLRPKCRTIKGFCELIVREWIIRGHPFRERFGQIISHVDGYNVQEAPVFLLFLDCIHQLINQNPFSFEFNDYFLLELYRDICYCYHHTFVFNSIAERLHAINNCPKNLLLLSSFDFSLYLYRNTYRLLKNHASIFTDEKYFSSRQQPSKRVVYRLEAPKPNNSRRENNNISPRNNSLPLNSEEFDYNTIESPQKFTSDLQVDWRIFNIVLWSKCYCRYDQNYLPTIREQQLSFEINCSQDDMENAYIRPRPHISIDKFHSIKYANSWHPQMLETRV